MTDIHIVRRAVWPIDAEQLRRFLEAFLGEAPWGVDVEGEVEPVAVASASQLADLLAEDEVRGLRGAEQPQRLLVEARNIRVRIERTCAELMDEGVGLGVVVESGRPVPRGDVRRAIAVLDADAALQLDESDGASKRARWGWIRPAQATMLTRDAWPGVEASEDGFLGPADRGEAAFDEQVREIFRRLRCGLPTIPGRFPAVQHAATLSSHALVPAQVGRPALQHEPHVPVPARVDPFSADSFAGDAGDLTALPRGTEPLDIGHLQGALDRGPLPFAGATSPERLAELRGAAAAEDPTILPVTTADDGDSTMMLPSAALRGQLAGPAFAPGLVTTAFPDLSVDRYAALAAEIEAKGSSLELLRRYELPTDASFRALKEEMGRRFDKDPALAARFQERVSHFLGFLRGKGGER